MEASTALERIVQCGTGPTRHRTIKVSFRRNGRVGSRDFATHLLHWYPAKMFHRIPQEIFDCLALPKRNTLILDPFCGSGTVPLEAAIRGYRSIGIDVNPHAVLISKVKTTPLVASSSKLRCLTKSIGRDARRMSPSLPVPHQTLDFWILPPARLALDRLSRRIDRVPDPDTRDFFTVVMLSIVRRVSLADPSIAPLVRLNPKRVKRAGPKYRKALESATSMTAERVFELFEETAELNIRRILQLHDFRDFRPSTLLAGLSAAATGLRANSVDLILTSPPYCGAQKYVRSLKLELFLSGWTTEQIAELDRETLGSERRKMQGSAATTIPFHQSLGSSHLIARIAAKNSTRARMARDYIYYLGRFAAECNRVLKPGGHAFVSFGTSHIATLRVDMSKFFATAARINGLEPIATLVDTIPSRSMITSRHSTAATIDDERIVCIRKGRCR